MDEEKVIERNESETLVEYRLTQIEKKLDGVTDLLIKDANRELRLKAVEDTLEEIKRDKKNNTERWVSPLVSSLISAIVSGIVAYIFVKVGLGV